MDKLQSFYKYQENVYYFSFLQKQPPEVLLGKDALKSCGNFTGVHPCRSAISIKLQSVFSWNGCSPVNLWHIIRTPFPKKLKGCFWVSNKSTLKMSINKSINKA